MSNDHVAEPFRSLLSDVREATQTLANCAAKGPLQKDGSRMSNDPYGMTAKEEREIETDETIERLQAENDRLLSLVVDLREALDEAINYIAVWDSIHSDETASALLDKCTAALSNSRRTP